MRALLGTLVAVEARAADESCALGGIAAAFETVVRVGTLMHPTGSGSDLTALQSAPPGVPVTVHPWTWTVLDICGSLNRLSNGVFDPCTPESRGRMTDIDLLPACAVRVNAPVRIDLGGIAKGFAVDRAIDALRAAGCEGGLVNAGGDVAAFGSEGHLVVCRGVEGADVAVELRDSALATSDVGHRDRPTEHRGYYHGRDPSVIVAGRVTVIAPAAATADALTKCLLAGDPDGMEELLQFFNARCIRN